VFGVLWGCYVIISGCVLSYLYLLFVMVCVVCLGKWTLMNLKLVS